MIRKMFRALYSAEAGVAGYAKMNLLLRHHREYIFIACMPKTASTFTRTALHHATGFRIVGLASAYERNEQELYLPAVIDAYPHGTVTQQHIHATGPNLELMQRFGIRPVILVRNLFDAVISLRDQLFAEGFQYMPFVYATEHLREMEEQEQFDFLITFGLPWYFYFYASWYDACRDGKVDALWITYEELSQDWVKGLGRILDFYSLSVPDDELERAIETTKAEGASAVRFNKGVVGRGGAHLTLEQQARIKSMADSYPWVDFSRVGIEDPLRRDRTG